jgi:hypothetical protein
MKEWESVCYAESAAVPLPDPQMIGRISEYGASA